jgi:integrase
MSGGDPGGLADVIEAFISFKRAAGVQFKGGEYYLRRFAAYCAERGIDAMAKEAVQGFITGYGQDNPDTDRSWTAYLRGLGRFAAANTDPRAYVLPTRINPVKQRPVPYLLTEAELEAFFEAAAKFGHPSPWAWQAKAFFGLMHSCGLRTCEVKKLDRADIDLREQMINIRWSKGPRSRRLPVGSQAARMLAACDRRNDEYWPGREPFFITGWKNRVGSAAPGVIFRRIWAAAGLPATKNGKKPRPYDLRHHFAYANLERWTRDGQAAAMLPYLTRYMGHASIESTCYYLHVSPDFTASYTHEHAHAETLLPEAGFDD